MVKVTSENYVPLAVRTDTPITPELLARFAEPQTLRLLHAAMGMATEAGEFVDMLKRHFFYGTPIDFPNAIEEIGDQEWYVALAIDVLQTTMDHVLTVNVEKLLERFPNGFNEHDAVNRDTPTERKLLETGAKDSVRLQEWRKVSKMVEDHIINYTTEQYGDEGEDDVTDYAVSDCVMQVRKYMGRYGRNVREGQQVLDFLKSLHYNQLALSKYLEVENNG